MADDPVIEEIRARCDIVELIGSYIPLRRAGTNTFKGLCPFHNEKTPSFHVDSAKQMFHCFGCGKGGDIFTFFMEKENVGFNDAKHMLAAKAGVIIPEYHPDDRSAADAQNRGASRERLYRINEEFCLFFERNLAGNPDSPAAQYLAKRGIPPEVIKNFRIGYAPDEWTACLDYGRSLGFSDEELVASGVIRKKEETGRCFDHFKGRVTFAIANEQNRVVGFSARSLEADPQGGKYINTPETPVFKKGNLLYALNLARKSIGERNLAILCEGQLDAIAFHRAGIPCAVAPQGTGFTEGQAHILKRYTNRIYLAFDADGAGQKAVLRALELLLPLSVEIKVIRIPGGKDPDELYRNGGAEAMQKAIDEAVPWLQILCSALRKKYDFQSPVSRGNAAKELLNYLNLVVNRIELDEYLRESAALLGMHEDSLYAELRHLHRRNARKLQYDAGGNAPAIPSGTAPEPEIKAEETLDVPGRTLIELALSSAEMAKLLGDCLSPQERSDGSIGMAAVDVIIRLAEENRFENAPEALAALLRERPCAALSAILVGEHAFPEPEKALADTISTMRRDRARMRRDELTRLLRSNPPFEQQIEILKEIESLKGYFQ